MVGHRSNRPPQTHVQSNPYSHGAWTQTRPAFESCDACDRMMPYKDMSAHKRSKKHLAAVEAIHKAAKNDVKADNGNISANDQGADAWGGSSSVTNGCTGGDDSWGAVACEYAGLGNDSWGEGFGEPTSNEQVSARFDGGGDDDGFTTARGGGGSMKCYSCQGYGHMSRECPEKRNGGGVNSSSGCHKCGEDGHFARDCINDNAMKCYSCQGFGHMSRDCPDKNARGGGDSGCRKCGEDGHFARECPLGGSGSSGGGRTCYGCGEEGHNKADCPNPGNDGGGALRGACYGCGEVGHNRADCPNGGSSGGFGIGGGGRTCYNCGEEGHISRGCTAPPSGNRPPRDPRGPKCYGCQQYGHKKDACPLTSTDDGYGAHGGYDSFNDLLPPPENPPLEESHDEDRSWAGDNNNGAAPEDKSWDKEW